MAHGLRRTVATAGWDLPLFAVATGLDQGGRLALNLAAAVVLGPADFGAWVVITLLLQYAVFLALGIPNGAGREIPRALGRGDPDAAAHTEDIASGGILATGLLASVAALVVAPIAVGQDAGLHASTLLLLALAVFLQQAFVLEQVLFRSRLRFRPASVQLAVQGAAAPVVGITLLLAGWGLDGLLLARVAVLVVALAMAGRTLARLPRPRWDPVGLRALIAIGLPLLAAGILLVLLITVDRWIVLALLGREALGVYGLVGFAASSLLLVPIMISQQYYPRLAFARGEGHDAATLLRMARGQGLLAAMLTGLAALFVAAAAWFGIPIALPAYREAIGPILVVLVGMVAYSSGSAYGNLLNLWDRQRYHLAIQAVVLVTAVALGVGLVLLGWGIMGPAVGTASAMVAYALLLHLVVGWIGTKGVPTDRPTSIGSDVPAAP